MGISSRAPARAGAGRLAGGLDEGLAAGRFDEVFHSLRPPLLRLARHLPAAARDAEDLVQDVMVELWSHRARFDPDRGSPAAWASSILRNRAVDRLVHYRGLSARQAAVVAGVSPSTFGSRLRAARRHLREAMSDLGQTG